MYDDIRQLMIFDICDDKKEFRPFYDSKWPKMRQRTRNHPQSPKEVLVILNETNQTPNSANGPQESPIDLNGPK